MNTSLVKRANLERFPRHSLNDNQIGKTERERRKEGRRRESERVTSNKKGNKTERTYLFLHFYTFFPLSSPCPQFRYFFFYLRIDILGEESAQLFDSVINVEPSSAFNCGAVQRIVSFLRCVLVLRKPWMIIVVLSRQNLRSLTKWDCFLHLD